MNQEIEIKLKINKEELDRIERELSLKNEIWHFERTYGFFTPNGESVKNGIFPRIKSTGNNEGWLDIKVKDIGLKTDYFERKEYRIYALDIKNTIIMLGILGYSKMRIFEKFRKKIAYQKVEICLDRLPFGLFVEIEGEKGNIEKMINKLGLKNNERIAKAYLKIADEMGVNDTVFGGGE